MTYKILEHDKNSKIIYEDSRNCNILDFDKTFKKTTVKKVIRTIMVKMKVNVNHIKEQIKVCPIWSCDPCI